MRLFIALLCRLLIALFACGAALPPRAVLAVAALITLLLSPVYVSSANSAPRPSGTVKLSVRAMGSRYLITASGTYTSSPSELDVYVHTGTQGCPATRQAENTRVEDQIQCLGTNAAVVLINYLLDNQSGSSRSYSQQGFWGGDVPAGTYWVCAYLLISRSPGHDPGDPPGAVASARLTVGGSGPAPTAAVPAVHIDRFYTITKAATDILVAHPGGPPPARASTFSSSTKEIYFYFHYRGARPHITQYEIHLHAPVGSGVEWGYYYNRIPLSFHNGNEVLPSSTYHYPKLSGSKAPLPTLYSVDLLVDGRVAARTSFRIER